MMDVLTELDPAAEARLRRGLVLLAERTPPPPVERPAGSTRLPTWAVAAAAAVALATAGGGITLAATRQHHPAASPALVRPSPGPAVQPSTTAPPLSTGLGVRYDLPRLVAESERIVVGTVVEVRHGPAADDSGGLAYVIATLRVEQTLKGAASTTVAAFDYDYSGAITSAGGPVTSGPVTSGSADGPSGATFIPGERVLLFLSSSAGTVHEQITPLHWQVTGGAQGEYQMHGDVPDATFTLDDVRQAAG